MTAPIWFAVSQGNASPDAPGLVAGWYEDIPIIEEHPLVRWGQWGHEWALEDWRGEHGNSDAHAHQRERERQQESFHDVHGAHI